MQATGTAAIGAMTLGSLTLRGTQHSAEVYVLRLLAQSPIAVDFLRQHLDLRSCVAGLSFDSLQHVT